MQNNFVFDHYLGNDIQHADIVAIIIATRAYNRLKVRLHGDAVTRCAARCRAPPQHTSCERTLRLKVLKRWLQERNQVGAAVDKALFAYEL